MLAREGEDMLCVSARGEVARGKRWAENSPSLLAASWHDGRAKACALLTSRNSSADKVEPQGGESLCPPLGVREVRVPTINDDVALLKVREELVDELVDRLTSLDHEHGLAGPLELGGQLLHRVESHDLGALGLVGEELIHLGCGPVVRTHHEPMVIHVQDQVLALSDVREEREREIEKES